MAFQRRGISGQVPGPPTSVGSLLRDAAILGLLTFLFVYIYFIYLTRVGFSEKIAKDVPPEVADTFLLLQLVMVLTVSLICAMVGLLLSKRYGLAGLGDWKSLKQSLPWLFGMAAIGVPATVFLFDLPFSRIASGYYPDQFRWALALVFASSFSTEIIARFGMMTIIMGVVRNFHIANVLQAAFITVVAARSFYLADHAIGFDYITIVGFCLGMVGSLAAGWIYYRFGILSAIFGHILFEARLLVFPLFFHSSP